MTSTPPPLVQLDDNGSPSVLNYNVPEPTSYAGRNLIRLDYPTSMFRELIGVDPTPDVPDDGPGAVDSIRDWLVDRTFTTMPASVHHGALGLGGSGTSGGGGGGGGAGGGGGGGTPGELPDDIELPKGETHQEPPITSQERVSRTGRRRSSPTTAPRVSSASWLGTRPSTPIRATALAIPADAIAAHLMTGRLPYVVATASGGTRVVFADTGTTPDPGIYLVETYRMSNFLGDYGAGRTVGTFSLLPGEKTTISITSYKNATSTESATSSVFDSYTTTAEDELESMIQSENSDTESKEKTTEWNVEAEASANWGVASASVSGGASGSTNTARESFAKNVSAATEKHAQSASSQRDITVNTSTVTTGTETAIEREIQNINVRRTLNFASRQLNQEHISLLHLVDVRVAFYNGYPDMTMERPIHELDTLLKYCVIQAEDRATIRADILFALRHITDYRQRDRSMLTTPPREFTERDGSTRTIETLTQQTSTYDAGGREITVEGIILSARSVVLRTDAVIVEALLGQADALDEYSMGLQDERVRELRLANDLAAIEVAERQARLDILAAGNGAAAQLWRSLFPEGVVESDLVASADDGSP